jgi:hypothetical protein
MLQSLLYPFYLLGGLVASALASDASAGVWTRNVLEKRAFVSGTWGLTQPGYVSWHQLFMFIANVFCLQDVGR